jgi:hypothetical protein
MDTMATLTIPDALYEQLKTAAADQQKSVDVLLQEAIERMSRTKSTPQPESLTREEKTQRLRGAMGDRVWSEEDVDKLFPWLDEEPMTEDEVDEILRNLPILEPPLSQTVIDMRNEE